jgi:hypothetical protein
MIWGILLLLPLTVLAGESVLAAVAVMVAWFGWPDLGVLVVAVGFFWLWRKLLGRGPSTVQFIETLDHELMHVLAGLMTGRKVRSINVSRDGTGTTTMEGSNLLVRMAPYFMSLPLAIALAIGLIFWNSTPSLLGKGVLAAIFAYHGARLSRSVGPHQTDFRSTGFVIGLLLTLAMLAIVGAVTLALVAGGREGVGALWGQMLGQVVSHAGDVWEWIWKRS